MLKRSVERVVARRVPGRCVGWISAAGVGLSVCLGSGTVAAQGTGASNQAVPLIAFEHQGLEAMFPDQRDAGLLTALKMLPSRLKEIHRTSEIQDELPWLSEEMVALGWDMLSQPTRFIVTNRGSDPNTGQPLLGGVLSIKMRDAATAQAYHQQLLGLISEHAKQAGVEVSPSKRIRTMSDIATPGGPLSFGPRDAADGWRYEVLFGSAPGPDGAFANMPKLPNATTTASFVLDFNHIGPLVHPFIGMATMGMPADQGKQLIEQLSAAGVIGENTTRIEWVCGHTPTHTVHTARVIGMKKNAEALGMPLEPLKTQDLMMLPRDTTAAYIWAGDPMNIWNNLKSQAGPVSADFDEVLAEFQKKTGVDLVNDVIGALGSTGAVYLSESAGGGSFLSAAFVSTLKDGGRLNNASSKLLKLANEKLGDSPSPDTIGFKLASSADKAGTIVKFRAEGLPIPFMPSYAIGEKHFVAGLTPQAVQVGLVQATASANHSLLANTAFAENLGRWESPLSINFIDSTRTIQHGYSLVQLGATMLETAVSSPYGDRSAPQVMPTLAELSQNLKPMLQITRWDGEDLLVVTSMDRSALATVSSLLGVGQSASLIMGGGIGAGLTAAIMKAYEERFGSSYEYDWDEEDKDWWMEDDEDDDVDF